MKDTNTNLLKNNYSPWRVQKYMRFNFVNINQHHAELLPFIIYALKTHQNKVHVICNTE